ncbi:MAG: polysaccharide biosynthesis protein [Clostridiales bacterium]|nr:polysaccharide biosynthesis protein [Clostridiales bacterium]
MGSKDTNEQNIITQATMLMVAGIVVRIIGVLYRSPVTSIIGDEGNGYYSLAYNLYSMVLLISSYSIPMAVSKIVSGKLALKQYREAHKIFRCALLYVLVVGGIACLFTFICAPILVPSSQAKAIPTLRVLAPAIFLSGFLGVLRGYFQAHSSMMPTSVSQIVEQIMNAIVSIGGALMFVSVFAGEDASAVPVFGAMGSAAGTVAGVAAGLVFMLLIYRQNQKYFLSRAAKDESGVDSSYKDIFKIIIFMVTPVILSTFVYNISTTIDQTIFMDAMDFKGMVSETAATLYGVFSGKYWVLINVPVALANAMSTAMIPAVSGTYTTEDYEACNKQVALSIKFTMMISIPCAVGLSVLAYPVMQVLFPQKATIDLAVRLLHIGCISIVFYSLSTITNGVLQGIGKVNIPLRNAAMSLVIHVILLTSLLYFTGLDLTALVFATIAYSLLMCLFNSYSVRKYLGYRQEIRGTFVMPAISALIMGVFCYVFYEGIYLILYTLLGGLLPFRLLVLICLMAAIVFGVIVFFIADIKLGGVSEDELRGFPKGYVIVRYAKRAGLIKSEENKKMQL